MVVTPEQAVDAAQGAFGRHAGFRALHARGILCSGRFVPSGAAAELSTAAFLSGEPVPATFRFSNGSGNPKLPDFAPDLRGMAVKLYLDDGSRADIVAVNAPVFSSPTPEGFVDLLRAQAAGPAAVLKLPMVISRHPRLLRAFPHLAGAMRPVASYAQVTYYGQHAFRWIDAGGTVRHVRYTLRPAAGEARISLAAARRAGREYLQEELRARLSGGGVLRFALEVQVAEADDPVDDPSRAWPATRRRVTAGHFEVTGPDTERETGDDVLVFDPTRVIPGIELSDDPVLRFRSAAYRESVSRRTVEDV
jgi:catalase